jgi:5-methylcytosine-specific restriction endonuclease McrA
MKPPTFKPYGHLTVRQVDRERGSAQERGYIYRFNMASIRFKRENPLCLGCAAVGRVAATEVTDHVIPHGGDMVIFWDRDRWQPLCKWHHDVVKQKLEGLYARGEAKASDLRIDSEMAKAMTLRLDPVQPLHSGAGG